MSCYNLNLNIKKYHSFIQILNETDSKQINSKERDHPRSLQGWENETVLLPHHLQRWDCNDSHTESVRGHTENRQPHLPLYSQGSLWGIPTVSLPIVRTDLLMGSSGWKATSLMEPAWPGNLYRILLLVVSHTYTNLQGIMKKKVRAFQSWGQGRSMAF